MCLIVELVLAIRVLTYAQEVLLPNRLSDEIRMSPILFDTVPHPLLHKTIALYKYPFVPLLVACLIHGFSKDNCTPTFLSLGATVS